MSSRTSNKTSCQAAFENMQIQIVICSFFSKNALLKLGLVCLRWRDFTVNTILRRKPWLHLEYDKRSESHVIRNTRLKSYYSDKILLNFFNDILENSFYFPCHQFTVNGGDLGSKNVQQFLFICGKKISAICFHRVIITSHTLQLLPVQLPNLIKLSITQPILSPLYRTLSELQKISYFGMFYKTLPFERLRVMNFDGTADFEMFESWFPLHLLDLIANISLRHLNFKTPLKILHAMKHITINMDSNEHLEPLQYLIKAKTKLHEITLLRCQNIQKLQGYALQLQPLLQTNSLTLTSLHGVFLSFLPQSLILPLVIHATVLIGKKSEQYFDSWKLQKVFPILKRLTLKLFLNCPNYFRTLQQVPIQSISYLEMHGDFPHSYWEKIYPVFPNILTLNVIFCPCGKLLERSVFNSFPLLTCVHYRSDFSQERNRNHIDYMREEFLTPRTQQPPAFYLYENGIPFEDQEGYPKSLDYA